MFWCFFWLLAILAYLLGSLSFAIWLSRRSGSPDPRASGSGNAGATNMLRVAGKKLAVLTLIGDLCKGLLPVLLAKLLDFDPEEQAWIGLFAVLGHLFPLYFRFRGGKGVATTAGMLLGLYPPAAALAICAWLLVLYLTRTSSLAALIATPLTLPLLAWQYPETLLPMSLITLLIVWRHRGNLRDLLAGRERHF
jgi:glycerol-3-phosphate acyltransferase PlsY